MSGNDRHIARRRFLTLAGAAGTVGLAGCGGGGGGGGGGSDGSDGGDGGGTATPSDGGDGGGSDGGDGGASTPTESSGMPSSIERIGYTSYVRGGAWITAYVEAGRFYAKDQGIKMDVRPNQQKASKQVQDIRDFTNKGFDGIIVGVWQTGAASDAIQGALDENIPVISTNADTANENIPLYVGFGNYEGGAKCAEEMYSALKNQKPDASPWRVLNVRGIQGNQSANQRSKGFLDVMKKKDDVTVLDTINGKYARDVALNKTQQWINNNELPHGIYSGNLTMGLGVRTALDNLGELYKKGSDKHVVLTQMDGGPEANKVIANGYIDAAVDQPNYFYNPLAIKYMMRIAQMGMDKAIPEVGTEVTADDLTIEPAQHKGVKMWSKPIWAPAKIDEQNGHPWFKTNNIVITQENADAPYLWGNVWG